MAYTINIEKETLENENFRKVLYTAKNSQLVVMSLKPKEDIGAEVHNLDQFIRVEKGTGKAVLNGEEHKIGDDSAIVIPAGTEHNIINTSETYVRNLKNTFRVFLFIVVLFWVNLIPILGCAVIYCH